VDTFYENVVQHLRCWSAPAPRLRDEPDAVDSGVSPALVSAALSSQDDPEPATQEPATPKLSAPAGPNGAGEGAGSARFPVDEVDLTQPSDDADIGSPADDPTPPTPGPETFPARRDTSWSSVAASPHLVRPLPTRAD
jgi:hypothetical protein